jgi:oligoendopeptidase F
MKKKSLVFFSLLTIIATLFLIAPSPASAVKLAAATPTAAPADNPQDHWKLSDIYPTIDAWEADFKQVQDTDLPRYKGYEGTLGDKAKLLEFLKMDEATSRTVDKLYVYAYMKLDEDNTKSDITELTGRVESLYSDYGTASSFFKPELLALPEATLDSYLKDADLVNYKMLLQYIVDKKAHTLSKEEEALLSQVGELANAPETIATKIREADLKFPTIKDPKGQNVEVSEANYSDALMNPNRAYREKFYISMMNTYGSMQNSLAAALDAQMRKDYFYASATKYESSLDAALGDNNIPKEVYTSLVNATDNNLSSLHKYVNLRKQILKVPTVRGYDMFVPLVTGYAPPTFTYAQTQQILADALKPLGPTYIKDMQSSFSAGWIDVYPADNKTSGAYSWASYDTHPYILTNFNGSFDSVLTLGHEMGHAMNYNYVNKAQGYYNSNTPIFNAEVASTTNELIILRYMVDHAKTDQEKLFYLDQLAEDIRGTFFTQVMYAEFELQIHERIEQGDALSVDSLNQMWGDVLAKYYGPDYEVTEQAKLGWSRIPHFYYDFYVYQYATGIAAADQFATDLSAGTPGATDKYLTFLKAGGSDYPVKVLQAADVDMLSSKPTDTLLADFDKTVTQMEDLLVKMGKLKK